MKLFIIINYINKNIFLNYYNYIKISNINNNSFFLFKYFLKSNIDYFINYKNKESKRS